MCHDLGIVTVNHAPNKFDGVRGSPLHLSGSTAAHGDFISSPGAPPDADTDGCRAGLTVERHVCHEARRRRLRSLCDVVGASHKCATRHSRHWWRLGQKPYRARLALETIPCVPHRPLGGLRWPYRAVRTRGRPRSIPGGGLRVPQCARNCDPQRTDGMPSVNRVDSVKGPRTSAPRVCDSGHF